MHWAAKYIGAQYRRGAEGPEAYDCWGLARAIFAERMGLRMPAVAVGEATNIAAMREIASGHGWARVCDAPRENDALLMGSIYGRHIAVCISADGRLAFIHADERAGVEIVASSKMFAEFGYSNIEVWRYASRNAAI